MIHTRLDDFFTERQLWEKVTWWSEHLIWHHYRDNTCQCLCIWASMFAYVWEMSCWQQTAVTMSASEGSNSKGQANTLSVWPRIPYTPVWLWNDRQSFYTVHQAHQIFRPWCKMLQKGSLLKGSCHFLRLRSLIVGRIHFSRSNSINLSLVYLNHVFLNQSRMLTE